MDCNEGRYLAGMYCERLANFERWRSGTKRRNFFDFLQLRSGWGVIGVQCQFGLQGCDGGVPVALRFTDQPENEMVAASLGVSRDRFAGVGRGFRIPFHL